LGALTVNLCKLHTPPKRRAGAACLMPGPLMVSGILRGIFVGPERPPNRLAITWVPDRRVPVSPSSDLSTANCFGCCCRRGDVSPRPGASETACCVRHAARLSVRTIPVSAGYITSGRAASHRARVDFRSQGPDYGRAHIAIAPSLTTDQGNRVSNARCAPLRGICLDQMLFRPISPDFIRYPGAGLA
jgi:hypothetical protein